MAKILVLYYSSYGHMEQMAYAAADGVQQAGHEAVVKRVAEIVPEEVAQKSHYKMDQKAPVATVQELAEYDGIIVGIPTRYGRMSAQMANFWDQAGSLWAKNSLVGKVGSVMSSTGTQHGGQEMTLFSGIVNLLHFGMVIVGLPYAFQGQSTLDEITGGAPYGATTIAGGQGQRQPSENEREAARYQGRHVAEIAAKLAGP